MKYSHNDYYTRNKILDALGEGITAVEADIVFIGDEIMLSHSWRPFKSWTHGNFIDEYLNPLYKIALSGKKMTLIIELKSVKMFGYKRRLKQIKTLSLLLSGYSHENLEYVIGCQYRWFHQFWRLVWLYDFHRYCKDQGYKLKIKDKRLCTDYNEQVDVFQKYGFLKRILNNQF